MCKALIWDPVEETCLPIGGPDPDGVFPMSLTSDGRVLGNARSRTGQAIACVSVGGDAWARLGTPDDWYATAMNDAGDVAGSLSVQGFGRPWLRRSDGSTLWLPFFEHHECRPTAMTDNGLVAGTAQTDHGSHALLWTIRD